MKGKRLYQLIKELNKTEHRQVVNACKASTDKRAIALRTLLGKRNLNETLLEEWLQLLVESWQIKTASERDKKQRRWIDFACKEIENQLLKNSLTDPKKRFHELARIFDERNNGNLTAYYNHHSLQNSLANNYLNSLISGYDIELRWLGRNQTKRNIERMGTLLLRRKEVTEQAFHDAMSYFYTVSSALYIDNTIDISYQRIAPTADEFKNLRSSAKDEYSSILYLLAEARFNFYNRKEFERLLHLIFRKTAGNQLDEKSKAFLERSSLYLRVTGGLYYGYPIGDMIGDAQKMLSIMLRYKMNDTVGFFFLLFFLLINKDMQEFKALLNKHKSTFFNTDSRDYLIFLQSLQFYLEQKTEKALEGLLITSYSNSPYLAAWSRLLEIKLYSDKEDTRFTQVLLGRCKRFLKNNSGRRIIYEPMQNSLSVVEAELQNLSFQFPKNIFAYYALLLPKARASHF